MNVRPCKWIEVGPVDAVPGKVVASFRPSRTVQEIHDETIQLFSAHVYNSRSAAPFRPPASTARDLFSLMSSEDCEDVVALYMQKDGYRLFPSTCKIATSSYEWVMAHQDSGQRATAQVKNGYDNLNIDEYVAFPGTVYLFTSKGRYRGTPHANVRCLSLEQIKDFMSKHRALLPKRIQKWIQISEQLSSISNKQSLPT